MKNESVEPIIRLFEKDNAKVGMAICPNCKQILSVTTDYSEGTYKFVIHDNRCPKCFKKLEWRDH